MRLIILDRDGVINEDSDKFIKSASEWVPIPGSLEAIARLNRAEYRVVVATNQSGIARGLFDLNALNSVHQQMHRALAELGGHIEAVFFCPHGPNDHCSCRKPAPGLLLDIAKRLRTDLNGVPAVGDSIRDIQAAQTVGAQPFLVRTGKGASTAGQLEESDGVQVFDDLANVADYLLADET